MMINEIPKDADQQTIVKCFLYHLHDTLVLLGGDKIIAEMLESPETINAVCIDALRRYNRKLTDGIKVKLISTHKLAVVVDREGK